MNIFKTKMKNPKIGFICVVVLAISIVSLLIAYLVKPEEWSWSSLFLNLAIALFQLFLALLIVNIYVSNKDRQKINLAVLIEVDDVIAKFHDHFVQLMVQKFGEKQFLSIMKELSSSQFNMNLLPEDIRGKMYDAIKKEMDVLMVEGRNCVDQISQTAKTGAFSNIPEVLSYGLLAQKKFDQIVNLRMQNLHDSNEIIKSFLMFDWSLHIMRFKLSEQGGLNVDKKSN